MTSAGTWFEGSRSWFQVKLPSQSDSDSSEPAVLRLPGMPVMTVTSVLTLTVPVPIIESKMLYLSVGQVRPLRWKIYLLSCAWFDNIN